jgi:hypothetical protein
MAPQGQGRSIPGFSGSGMQLLSSGGMNPSSGQRAFPRGQPTFPLYAEDPERRFVRETRPVGAFLEHGSPGQLTGCSLPSERVVCVFEDCRLLGFTAEE